MAFDIEDVRLKDIEELSKEEKDFLKENQKNLTDSERDYFKDAWGDEEEEDDDKGDKGDKGEDKPFKSFKTQEEHDKYMEDEFSKRKPPKKEKAKADDDRLFDKAYKPKDWDAHAKELDAKLYPRFKARMTKERKEAEDSTRQLIADQNKKWDDEIETLRTSGEDIPALGTKERITFDKAVTQTLVDYGMTSMTKAFDVWKMKGGKVKTKVDKGDEDDTSKQEEEQRRRDLAAKVGKGGGTRTKSKEKKYSDVAGRSMDEIFESAEERLK